MQRYSNDCQRICSSEPRRGCLARGGTLPVPRLCICTHSPRQLPARLAQDLIFLRSVVSRLDTRPLLFISTLSPNRNPDSCASWLISVSHLKPLRVYFSPLSCEYPTRLPSRRHSPVSYHFGTSQIFDDISILSIGMTGSSY